MERCFFSTSPISAETIYDIILDPNEVYNELFHLDPNKAPGHDNISIRLLKECATSITTSLTCLFNKSLQHGTLPSEWKLSNAIPVHKKGDKSFVENYMTNFLIVRYCILIILWIIFRRWYPLHSMVSWEENLVPASSFPFFTVSVKIWIQENKLIYLLQYYESVWYCGS